MAITPRRPMSAKDAAEALFKPVKKPVAPAVERQIVPKTREMVTLRLDSDVLAHFQSSGPGWQERVNALLRAAMNDQGSDRGSDKE